MTENSADCDRTATEPAQTRFRACRFVSARDALPRAKQGRCVAFWLLTSPCEKRSGRQAQSQAFMRPEAPSATGL